MTLRGLYNYVMKAITNRPSINATIDEYELGKSSLSLQRYSSAGTSYRDVQNSPPIGPRRSMPIPARARSGSVGIAYSTTSPPPAPPLLCDDSNGTSTSRPLPPALNLSGSVRSFRLSGQSPSTRNVRFQPQTTGTSGNDERQCEGDRNGAGGEDGEDGVTCQVDPNAHVTFRERLGGYLHPRDMR